MRTILVVVALSGVVAAQQPANVSTGVVIPAGVVEETLKDSIARTVVDQPIKGTTPVPILGGKASVAMLRRVKPETNALIHDRVTEIYRIIEGSGTLLTGGSLKGAKPTDLTRVNAGMSQSGEHIGGESRRIGPKDIVIVPAGTPHRLSQLDGPIVYEVYRFEPGPEVK